MAEPIDLKAVVAWLVDGLGYPVDFLSHVAPPRDLQVAIAQHMWNDPQERYTLKAEFDNDPEQWFMYIAEESDWSDG